MEEMEKMFAKMDGRKRDGYREHQMKSLSNTWPALVKAYARYRRMPVWGTMKRVPNRKGRLRRQDIDAITQRGKAAVARVQKAIDKF